MSESKYCGCEDSTCKELRKLEKERGELRAERDDARENSNKFQMQVMQLRAALEEIAADGCNCLDKDEGGPWLCYGCIAKRVL